jgi:hypothetical protein
VTRADAAEKAEDMVLELAISSPKASNVRPFSKTSNTSGKITVPAQVKSPFSAKKKSSTPSLKSDVTIIAKQKGWVNVNLDKSHNVLLKKQAETSVKNAHVIDYEDYCKFQYIFISFYF